MLTLRGTILLLLYAAVRDNTMLDLRRTILLLHAAAPVLVHTRSVFLLRDCLLGIYVVQTILKFEHDFQGLVRDFLVGSCKRVRAIKWLRGKHRRQ